MQETTARVQFDKKYLIALVLPLVIEQVLAVTVGMADMIMVSGAGDTAVSGVSLVNTISNLLIYIFLHNQHSFLVINSGSTCSV